MIFPTKSPPIWPKADWLALVSAVLPILDQVINDPWVGQCRRITKLGKIIGRNFSQDTPHDFS